MTTTLKNFTPREIVSELDRYIIGQNDAKRAVAIAMRSRWRRMQVDSELRDEIAPKNIIMIGPTGVGKTEIARRLAHLAGAPFIKVEASKFTEVGYVGKDVESMIRELTEIAINQVREEEEAKVQAKAEELAEERLLDILMPRKSKAPQPPSFDPNFDPFMTTESTALPPLPPTEPEPEDKESSREKMREMLRSGRLDSRSVELEAGAASRPMGGMGMGIPMIEVVSTGAGLEDLGKNLRDMFSSMGGGKGRGRKKVKIPEALKLLKEEEAQKLVDMDEVTKKAIACVEQNGIVFIDEIDKIASREKGGHGPDVSREGVQRDILPIVEGSRVSTKYGTVRTDHILFIAAGAFHVSKPSDLIPELQGRFPIRVELKSLTEDDFLRILTEPKAALSKQYRELLKTEKVELEMPVEGLREVARYAARANEQMENIGARRLHTILEKVLDEISFTAPENQGKKFTVDAAYVKKCLEEVIKNQDLSRYIL